MLLFRVDQLRMLGLAFGRIGIKSTFRQELGKSETWACSNVNGGGISAGTDAIVNSCPLILLRRTLAK